ncbi:Cell wall-associated hydrolase, NlpC family [Streptoalloteichus tenebrarius]|uniref:Cell wall-associated hydrolase, NlpC family n=1 Tax=Streptoalloteichus tenebrarius (strain ATCC 17920 / DSM 40477 / JCM 4838 / CBS 697.72 / NBRC 16177 / NCIMB 11028 / NRRL B-12390 / A12253. 1 / ISP 5477) TaxID=1933 RepID=A0ABT1HS29_STRSD|nr:hypothetical protein [Streptoalloteichus tenebrarius]MCP2258260.1 Cell wall-associated hydrolase, NlpC family [Streptoalloteichus tenebrarius]BFF04510.1 hypothetical protein GCM10020241_61850 [Streptoalloteichus tenebrarius]
MGTRKVVTAVLPASALVLGLLSGLTGTATAAPAEAAAPNPSVVDESPEGVQEPEDITAADASYGGTITRNEVMKRAKDWWDRKVPYNQNASAWDINKGKKYRTDCSGYVSMAWKLKTSRTTYTLDEVSKKIGWGDLKPGDIVLSNGHVKLFEKWADSKKTVMWIYEQGSTKTDMDHEKVSVSWLKNNGYTPRKYDKIK